MLSQDNTYKKSTSKKGKYSESFPTATIMMGIKAIRNSLYKNTIVYANISIYISIPGRPTANECSPHQFPQTGSNSFKLQRET